jgi:hypothetical protein
MDCNLQMDIMENTNYDHDSSEPAFSPSLAGTGSSEPDLSPVARIPITTVEACTQPWPCRHWQLRSIFQLQRPYHIFPSTTNLSSLPTSAPTTMMTAACQATYQARDHLREKPITSLQPIDFASVCTVTIFDRLTSPVCTS